VEAVALKERLIQPSVGAIAAVKFSEDGMVYRGKVGHNISPMFSLK
jgi:hypothetical protein